MTTPQLSSVYQSSYQMGATAAQLALDRVANRSGPVRRVILKTELKVRGSVAPPLKELPPLKSSVRKAKAGQISSGI
ncbi:MAG: substrate-binding domain-containing protein [Acidobacteriaceae bacterium]